MLLSAAYAYGKPVAEPPDEYEKVRAENDWNSAQSALFPKQLRAFCCFNPLKNYALAELTRCAQNPNIRRGIKLHFANSDVQLENPDHFEKQKVIIRAANTRQMAIVVHLRASISKKSSYGADQARRFFELLAFAPNVPGQIAHLASTGPGYNDPPAHSVVQVLAEAVSNKDSRTRNLWFDIATVAVPANSAETSTVLMKLIRRIGVRRILYGSDAAAGSNLQPRESWKAFCNLGLSKKEIQAVGKNITPYLREK